MPIKLISTVNGIKKLLVKWTLAGPKIIEIVKSLAFQGRKTLESFSRSFWQPVGPQM